jgi:C-terminal processing protease CtpA/Prc
MILEKSKRFAEPFEHDMSGLQFDPTDDGGFVVRSVIEGSPAEGAQIAVGDRLLGIDGKTVAELRQDGIRKGLIGDGKEVTLEISRGSETIEKHLKLRRMI